MAPPGGIQGCGSPLELPFTRERGRKGGFSGPVQRGDVMTERRSPRLSPARWELPVLDVASPPSTLTLRPCLRAAEVAARAGQSSALLLLVLLSPLSLSGCPGPRSRGGAGHSTSAPDAAWRGARREGGRARVGGRRAGRRAGAREGRRRGRRVSHGPGRPGDVDA